MQSIIYIEKVSQEFFLTEFDTGFFADIRGREAVQYSRLPLDLCCSLEDRIHRLISGVVWSGGCVFCFVYFHFVIQFCKSDREGLQRLHFAFSINCFVVFWSFCFAGEVIVPLVCWIYDQCLIYLLFLLWVVTAF